jgi:hypothetical protein
MARYQITCINKNDRYNPYERILYVGNNSGATPWKITQQDAIQHIESRTHSFYVNVGGREVDVIVAISPYGNKYIKTTPDHAEPNNLLNLAECPN